MPTVTGHAFVPNQFSYFSALLSACKTKNPTKALEVGARPLSVLLSLCPPCTSSLYIILSPCSLHTSLLLPICLYS
jgi:hypothetical protein